MTNEILRFKKPKENKKEGLNRRDFLEKFALISLGSVFGGGIVKSIDYYQYLKKEEILDKIFNELPNYIYLADITAELVADFLHGKDIHTIEKQGCGIILNGKYITTAHIPDCREEIKYFGYERVKKRKVEINKKELKELVCDSENDIAIYELPKDLKKELKEFPCKPRTKVKLGERIFLVGNPRLVGSNTRHAYISDIDGFEGMEMKMDDERESIFGIDTSVIDGDSGTPVVNENYELLGLCSIGYDPPDGLGYVKRIKGFLKQDCMKNMKTSEASIFNLNIFDFPKNLWNDFLK